MKDSPQEGVPLSHALPPGAQGRAHPGRPRRQRARPPHPHRRGAQLPKDRAGAVLRAAVDAARHPPRRSASDPLSSTEGPRGDLRDHDFGAATMTSWRAACPERQSSRRRRESAGNPWRLGTNSATRFGRSGGRRGTTARCWPDPPRGQPLGHTRANARISSDRLNPAPIFK